jgi:hypothetical protein
MQFGVRMWCKVVQTADARRIRIYFLSENLQYQNTPCMWPRRRHYMEIPSLQSVRFVRMGTVWDRETSTDARMGGHYIQMLLEKLELREEIMLTADAAYSTVR